MSLVTWSQTHEQKQEMSSNVMLTYALCVFVSSSNRWKYKLKNFHLLKCNIFLIVSN